MKRVWIAALVVLFMFLAYVPAASAGSALRVQGSEQQKKLINKVVPVYPQDAKDAHIQGTVRMEVKIDADGNVSDIKVQSGHKMLVDAAVTAVKQWRYEKTYLNGKPVEVITTVDVNFVLEH